MVAGRIAQRYCLLAVVLVSLLYLLLPVQRAESSISTSDKRFLSLIPDGQSSWNLFWTSSCDSPTGPSSPTFIVGSRADSASLQECCQSSTSSFIAWTPLSSALVHVSLPATLASLQQNRELIIDLDLPAIVQPRSCSSVEFYSKHPEAKIRAQTSNVRNAASLTLICLTHVCM